MSQTYFSTFCFASSMCHEANWHSLELSPRTSSKKIAWIGTQAVLYVARHDRLKSGCGNFLPSALRDTPAKALEIFVLPRFWTRRAISLIDLTNDFLCYELPWTTLNTLFVLRPPFCLRLFALKPQHSRQIKGKTFRQIDLFLVNNFHHPRKLCFDPIFMERVNSIMTTNNFSFHPCASASSLFSQPLPSLPLLRNQLFYESGPEWHKKDWRKK